MFKSKSALAAIIAGTAVAALFVAGMAMNVASGAGTDISGGPAGDLIVPGDTANPPAAPIEPPASTPIDSPNTIPTAPEAGPDNTGGQLGDSGAPGALPNAGYGSNGNSFGAFALLLALSGVALATGGATLAVRRK